VPVALLLLAGAGLTLAGSIGLLRLRGFYERLHAPTLGTSYGMGCILAASMIFFSVLQTRLVVHEIVIGVFVVLTMVPRGGIEPPTLRFSVACSTN
jgi:multicomponent K+:H+ antiporter subunit G